MDIYIYINPHKTKWMGLPFHPTPKSPQKTFQTFQCQPGPQPPVHVPSNGVQELPATQYLATWQPMGSLDEKNRWFVFKRPAGSIGISRFFFHQRDTIVVVDIFRHFSILGESFHFFGLCFKDFQGKKLEMLIPFL